MQNNNSNNKNGPASPSRNQDQNQDDSAGKANNGSRNGWSVGETVIIPTKTHDGGGGMSVRPDDGEGGQQLNNGGGSRGETASRPDSFQTYSDIDTRMTTLLGLEPPSNPNDGEELEDWRQLTGFLGLGGRRQPLNLNNDGDDDREVEAQAAPINGNGEVATPRKTRISWELHTNAFESMWLQRGELALPRHDPGPPRMEPRQQRDREGENQNGQDDEGELE